MYRLPFVALAALLSGSALLATTGTVTHAAVPRPTTRPTPAITSAAGTLLAPQPGSKVSGALALLGAASGGTTISLIVEGLQPGSRHTAVIRTGSCTQGASGVATLTLPPLVADSVGDAAATVLARSLTPLPASGLYVTAQQHGVGSPVLACGNIHRPTLTVTGTSVMGSAVRFTALMTEPAPVLARGGTTTVQGTEVIEVATGLRPGTANPTHIHAAPCGVVAPVVYPLGDLVADGQGRAIVGAGITDLVPTTGLSIHVHNTLFAMTACGTIG